jgi:uncharacterized protein YodC (DUF2158 family)
MEITGKKIEWEKEVQSLKVGDVVKLKSVRGGVHCMTVITVWGDGTVTCMYYNCKTGKYSSDRIPVEALRRINRK